MNNLRNVLEDCVNADLLRIIISNPRKGEKKTKIEVKPFEQKGTILYQCAEYRNNQVFHKNLPPSELSMYCLNQMELYKQIEIWCASKQVSALVNKKGKATINVQKKTGAVKLSLSHNRKKNYILSDSEPIPFLVELGVQTKEGKVVDKKKKKFKQINRFLEFIEMEHTPKNLLIRAVKKKGKKEKSESYQNMCREMHVKTTLERLIEG